MPTGRYFIIPFLKTRSQMGQTKNRSSEKLHKRDKEDLNICYKLLLRANNNNFLNSVYVIYDIKKHSRYNSELIGIIDDDIKPHNRIRNAASTKPERERE